MSLRIVVAEATKVDECPMGCEQNRGDGGRFHIDLTPPKHKGLADDMDTILKMAHYMVTYHRGPKGEPETEGDMTMTDRAVTKLLAKINEARKTKTGTTLSPWIRLGHEVTEHNSELLNAAKTKNETKTRTIKKEKKAMGK